MTVFSWPHGHSGEFRDDLLTAEPEFQSTEIGPEDEFLLMACDGLWDVLGKQEAVYHARAFFDEVRGSCLGIAPIRWVQRKSVFLFSGISGKVDERTSKNAGREWKEGGEESAALATGVALLGSEGGRFCGT